jgi:hypothetical protein
MPNYVGISPPARCRNSTTVFLTNPIGVTNPGALEIDERSKGPLRVPSYGSCALCSAIRTAT